MATKKRPARKRAPAKKKAPAKTPANSQIQAAQKASRDSLAAVADADRKKKLADYAAKQKKDGTATQLSARTGPMATSGAGVDPELIAQRDIGTAASQAANKIAGLAQPIMKEMQAAAAARQKQGNALADVSLYGNSNKNRATKIADLQNAYAVQANQQIKTQGRAVWMGPKTIKIRSQGPERMDPDTGSTTTTEKGGDEVLTKEELMSWLTDDVKVKQIIAFAQKAGLNVQTYDDAAKLWGSVVDMAASAYSFAGKQVTPWSIIQLRGKNAGPGGKPADKLVTQKTVNEVSPADARLMFEKSMADNLGREPTKAEVDDYIAKAQTIAKSHPDISYTTQHIGFDGNIESQDTRNSPGGSQALQQQAALDQAKQSEDYSSYQAAGVYMPWLMDALASPI